MMGDNEVLPVLQVVLACELVVDNLINLLSLLVGCFA